MDIDDFTSTKVKVFMLVRYCKNEKEGLVVARMICELLDALEHLARDDWAQYEREMHWVLAHMKGVVE